MSITASKSFTPSKPGDGLRAFAVEASAPTQLPANDTLQAVHRALVSVKPVRLDGASLTARQVHAFCDHLEVLLRSRVFDPQTFTPLTDPQSIMTIGLRFMTSKVMARVPVADWKTDWEVSTIIEALRECYPLTAHCTSRCRRRSRSTRQTSTSCARATPSASSRPWQTMAACQRTFTSC